MSRKGSGFRRDQNIGKVSIGPVRMMSMIPQITISSHGLRANFSPCKTPGRIALCDTKIPNINHANMMSAAKGTERDDSYFLKEQQALRRVQPLEEHGTLFDPLKVN